MRLQLTLASATALALAGTPARAQDRLPPDPGHASVVSKVGAYADDDETTVLTTLVDGEVVLPAHATVGAHALVDVVSTASVDVVAAATRVWHETRYEGGARAGLGLGAADLGLGAVVSAENDWSSLGVRATLGLDLAQKNARLEGSWSTTANAVGRAADPAFEESLRVHSLQLGATQLLDARTLVGASYTLGVLDGYQSSPYRFVTTSDARFSVLERHPDGRIRHALTLRALRALGRHASAEVAYRLYGDDWGVLSHTLTATLRLELGRAWELRLRARAYSQGAAAFFRGWYAQPARYMTADRELSTFWDVGGGPKVAWRSGAFTLDAKVDATTYRFLDFARLGGRVAIVADLGAAVQW